MSMLAQMLAQGAQMAPQTAPVPDAVAAPEPPAEAEPETKSPHHAHFQPRNGNGKFKGPPDKDALDKAIRKAMGDK